MPLLRRAAAALALALACAAPHAEAPQERRAATPPLRLLLAPLNFQRTTAVPAELEAGMPVLAREIERFLRDRGHTPAAVAPARFRSVWDASAHRAGGLAIGRSDVLRDRFGEVVRESLRQLHATGAGPFDALVFSDLAFRSVEFSGSGASWDGVYRRMHFRNQPRGFVVDYLAGTTTGLSLRAVVYSVEGVRLFEGYGGLALAYRMDLAEGLLRPELRDDALADPAQLREGIAAAFHPFI